VSLCGLLVKVDLSECFSLYTAKLPLRGGVHTSPSSLILTNYFLPVIWALRL
jgi:hypothetical protein